MSESEVPSSVLHVDGVTKSYGSLKALDDVSIHVNEGEFVALLGPNGAGKSTLFQLLSGLFVADSGRIAVGGHDISSAPVAALAKLGVVFQQATLDLDMGVRANLMFHARLHGLSAAERKSRIDHVMDRYELRQHKNKPCRALSGGNRRKVELGRALLHAPQILLMDEATVGLDPGSRRQLLDDVHTLCETESLAVLWATHLVDEAERADRIIVLHRGKLISEGTPRALAERMGESDLGEAFLKLTDQGNDKTPS